MKANGGKRMSFSESAHQSYLKTAIAMPTSGHSKNFVEQCYQCCVLAYSNWTAQYHHQTKRTFGKAPVHVRAHFSQGIPSVHLQHHRYHQLTRHRRNQHLHSV